MQELTLDDDALRACLGHLFGGNISELVRHWRPSENRPHKSTISRWLNGQTLPRSKRELLSLAGSLQIDPFGLWSIDPQTFAAVCDGIFAVSRGAAWAHWRPAFSFIHEFVRPSAYWPPANMAKSYFGHDWITVDRSYPARANRDYFEAFLIDPEANPRTGANQVFHFAWRPREESKWRPYGFVKMTDLGVSLFSFAGATAEARFTRRSRRSFCVETWLGQGSADFRIASIQPFSLKVLDTAECGATVRFR